MNDQTDPSNKNITLLILSYSSKQGAHKIALHNKFKKVVHLTTSGETISAAIADSGSEFTVLNGTSAVTYSTDNNSVVRTIKHDCSSMLILSRRTQL